MYALSLSPSSERRHAVEAQPVRRVVGRARRRRGPRRRGGRRRRWASPECAPTSACAAPRSGGRGTRGRRRAPGPAAPTGVARLVLLAAGAPQPAAAAVAVVVAHVTRGEVARAAEGGDEVDGDVALRLPRVVLGAVPRPPDEEFPLRRVLVEHLLHLVDVFVARHAVLKVAQAEDRRRRRARRAAAWRRCPRSRRRCRPRPPPPPPPPLRLLLRAGSRRAAEFVEKRAPLVGARPPSSPRATRGRGRGGGGEAWPRPSTPPPDASRRPTPAAPAPTAGRARARISSSRHAPSSGPAARFFCAVLLPRDEAAVISGVLSPAVTRPLRSASRDACTRLRLTRMHTRVTLRGAAGAGGGSASA